MLILICILVLESCFCCFDGWSCCLDRNKSYFDVSMVS